MLQKGDVCLITGVGEGTGLSCVRKFANQGYRVAMLARNKERLERIEKDLDHAYSFPCDVADLDNLMETCKKIKRDLDSPTIFIHNAVRGNFETILEGNPEWLEINFRINTTSFLHTAQLLVPDMIKLGRGCIIVTGNTAAKRGIAKTPYFAPTKAAQRILAQSLARYLGPKNIHVAYLIIDAAIDTPSTRPRLQPNKPDSFFCLPKDIADEIYYIAHQDKSAWSFDVELRPDIENW